MRKPRDYRALYRHRIEQGLAKGLTRAEARGHSTKPKRKRGLTPKHEPSERALLDMMSGSGLGKAARKQNVSPERLRRYLKEHTRAKYKGGKWTIRDKHPVAIRIIEDGRLANITADRRARSVISDHWRGVRRYLRSNRTEDLAAIQSISVRDTRGTLHDLEDRPNVLRRLASAGELSFLTIYADTPSGGVSP